MRLFYAIPIPPDVCARLSAEADMLAACGVCGRWTLPVNYHLTLLFLGELPEETLPVLESVGSVFAEFSAFRLDLRGFGAFESGRRAVLWFGTVPNPALDALQHALGEAVPRLVSIVPELRPYRPHVTLAREAVGLPDSWPETSGLSFDVEEACLMHGTRIDGRIAYLPLKRFPLGTAATGGRPAGK